MLIWFALVIPVLSAVVLLIFWRRFVTWWELAIPVAAAALLIVGFKAGVESSLTTQTEYWGSSVARATYTEHWDEEVSCRHSYNCRCKKDSKGNESCDTCYSHAYDVDDHPETWTVAATSGETFPIGSGEYSRLTRQFGNQAFRALHHHNVHSINGNAYDTTWPGTDETLEAVTTAHTYENRVQASNSIFRFQDVDPKDVATYGLYQHPGISNYSSPALLGFNSPAAERALQVINARLGARKQVRVYLLVFRDKPIEAGALQQRYWQGGNKNEFVMTVGIDKAGAVLWAFPFSWSEREGLKIDARNHIMEQPRFDPVEYATWLRPQILRQWQRKRFRDFNYLTVEPPTWAVVTTYLLTTIVTVVIAFWIVRNDFVAPDEQRRRREDAATRRRRYPWA